MIRILNSNLEKIAESYFQQILPLIRQKSNFLLTFLDVLAGNQNHDAITNHPLNGTTKKALLNRYITIELIDQQHYDQVAPNIKPWIMANLADLLTIVNDLDDPGNLRKLIMVHPEKAETLNLQFELHFNIVPVTRTNYYSIIKEVIHYPLFNRFAYDIAANLGLGTCPYCNRNFIHTVIDRDLTEVIRPTFDHFFSQKDHPLLSLSFYNLVPSCYNCNSNLKGETEMKLDTHMHPYLEGFDNDAVFHVLIENLLPEKSHPKNYALSLINKQFPIGTKHRRMFGNNPSEGNINLFQLQEIYRSHLDVVGELVVKCDKLNATYSNSLTPLLQKLNTDQAEFYRFHFGNYLDEKDFHRRPLAKMTRDVVNQALPFFKI